MLTPEAEQRLADNPDTFQRAWIEVVLESSPDTPTGIVTFDDRGRWISVEPIQIGHPLSVSTSTEEPNA